MTPRFLSRWLPALALSITVASLVAACGGGDDFTVRETKLTTTQEVEEVHSLATGIGVLTLNTDRGDLSGLVTVSGMTPTMAHIHSGVAGTNGAVLIDLVQVSGQANQYRVPDNTVLNPAQIAAFKSGGLYLNVHSAAFPNGEVRGQINREVQLARLSGLQELEQNKSTASGLGVIAVDPDSRNAEVTVTYAGLTPTMAHLHTGAIGTKGDVLIDMAAAGAGKYTGSKVLTDAQLADFRAKRQYFNVHTAAFPDGEIRGQIGYQVRIASMTGAEESPPVVTASTGIGFYAFDPDSGKPFSAFGQMTLTGFTPTMAHVHRGPRGSNGDVITNFVRDTTQPTLQVYRTPANTTLAESDALLLVKDGLYLNAHSAAHTGGEVRGQLAANKK
ncbi:MAG TPA: CHRD domain-containing protein [Burkholderiaceae bacterium]